LKQECEVLFGGDEQFQPIEADAQKSSFVQPTLLASKNGLDAKYVHDVEVFGPAATLVAYDSLENLIAIVRGPGFAGGFYFLERSGLYSKCRTRNR